MKYTLILFAIAVLTMAGCGGNTTGLTQPEKLEGPPVSTLSHDQLMALYQECTQYGRVDDPKVLYTARYCAAVQIAQLSEGYTKRSAVKVDPTLNRLH